MPFKFEKLEIWKLAIEFANDVHNLSRNFPKEEMFSLTTQFKKRLIQFPLILQKVQLVNQMQSKENLLATPFALLLNVLIAFISLSEENILHKKNLINFTRMQKLCLLK